MDALTADEIVIALGASDQPLNIADRLIAITAGTSSIDKPVGKISLQAANRIGGEGQGVGAAKAARDGFWLVLRSRAATIKGVRAAGSAKQAKRRARAFQAIGIGAANHFLDRR